MVARVKFFVFLIVAFSIDPQPVFTQYWEPIPNSTNMVGSMTCDASGNLWVGTTRGDVYLYNGTIWENKDNLRYSVFAIAVALNGDIYAANSSLYRSTDRGTSWDTVFTMPNYIGIYDILISESGEIYFGTNNGNGVYIPDGSGSWRRANVNSGNILERLTLAPNGTLYTSGNASTYSSTDRGNSWMILNNIPSISHLYGVPATGRLAFVDSNTVFFPAGHNGIFKSIDGGQSWNRCVDIPLTISGRRIYVADIIYNSKTRELFASIRNYTSSIGEDVFRSPDLGETWDLCRNGIPIDMDISSDLSFNPITGETYIVDAFYRYGMYSYVHAELTTIEIEPTSIDFGDVLVRRPSEQSVRIKNNDNAPLVISQVSITGDAVFNLLDRETTITIPAGEYHDLTVRFLPINTINYAGMLTLIHNAYGSPTAILLKGRGVPSVAEPNISIDSTNINFGDVLVSTSITRTFKITNDGDADLEISSMNLTGTDADLFTFTSSSPITITPSQNCDITVRFLPDIIGIKNAELNIAHNATGSLSTIQLTGRGVQAEISLNPNDIINFGDVSVNNSSSDRHIAINNTGTAPLTITNLQITGMDESMFKRVSSPDSVLFQSIIIGADSSFTFTFNFIPTSAGAKNARVVFTHSLGQSEVAFTGVGRESAISVTPNPLDFGDVDVNSSLQKSVTITNNGNAPLVVSSFDINGSVFTLPNNESMITIHPDSVYELTVQFLPTVAIPYTGTLTLTHNGSSGLSSVQLIGRGVQADISLNPNDIIDFGGVSVNNSSSDRHIAISNIGTAQLTITNLQITGTDESMFKRASSPDSVLFQSIIIGADSSFTFTFNFTPTSAGAKNARVVFTHSLGQSEVAFTGVGLVSGISVTPNSLDFGDVKVKNSKREIIRITNNGSAPLVVSSFDINGSVFTLPNNEGIITIQPDSVYELTVQFSPTVAIDYTSSIILTHNAESSPANMPLSGRGISSAITLYPTSIDFGDVMVGVGSFIDRSIQITNSGTDTLNILYINTTGAGASLFSLPNGENTINLVPDGIINLIVRFSPNLVGQKTATLNIISNALTSPDEVSLQGNGIISNVRVTIDNYKVKANEMVKVSIQTMDDLTNKNVEDFSFILKYNKRILSFKDVTLSETLSNSLGYSTEGSTPGELVVKVTNNAKTPLIGTGSLIDINFIGLRGDSCGTYLVLESFAFNSDGPSATTENGYCELFGGCGKEQTYITTDQSPILSQNSPNPVREGYESTIQYRINVASVINLTVYDILGREVVKLVNEYKSEGTYSVNFNTKGLPSGVYFYKLKVSGYEAQKKMLIIR